MPDPQHDVVATRRRTFQTLDAIRGIAALFVVVRHAPRLFGFEATEAHLAVDLFFGLSGFVIAEAYGRRLAEGLGVWQFMKIRIIRLYPIYILALALAIVLHSAMVISGHQNTSLDWRSLATLSLKGTFLVPATETDLLFPLNVPSWSLFVELIANLLFACAAMAITSRRLYTFMVMAAAALAWATLHMDSLNFGGAWGGFWVALLRIGFSFSAGLAIHRLQRRTVNSSALLALCILVVAIALCATPSQQYVALYEVFAVLFLFPAVIYVAAQIEPQSRFAGKTFALTGGVSYGIYIIHDPFLALFYGITKRLPGLEIDRYAPYPGLLVLVVLVVLVWAIDKYYDQPVRKILTARYSTRPEPLAAARGSEA